MTDRGPRGVENLRLVVELAHLSPRRKHSAETFELAADAVDDLDGARAGLLAHHQGDCRPIIGADLAVPRSPTGTHRRDRVETHRAAVGERDRNGREVGGAAQTGVGTDHDVLARAFDETGRLRAVRPSDRRHQVVDSEPEREQPRRRRVDPQRRPLAAQDLDQGDAVDAHQPRGHLTPEQRPELDGVAGRGHGPAPDLLQGRADLLEARDRPGRQTRHHLGDRGHRGLACGLDPGAPGELRRHHRDALLARRGHPLHAGGAPQRSLQPTGHQQVHVLCGQLGSMCDDVHDRHVEVREEVDAHVEQPVAARTRQDEGQERGLERPREEASQHPAHGQSAAVNDVAKLAHNSS